MGTFDPLNICQSLFAVPPPRHFSRRSEMPRGIPDFNLLDAVMSHEHCLRACSPLLLVVFRSVLAGIRKSYTEVRFSRIWRPEVALFAYTNDASNPLWDWGGWPQVGTETLGPE